MTPAAEDAQRRHVLHVADCYDGGVSKAINDMVANAPFVEHSLVYHGDEAPPPGTFTREVKVTGGRLARMGRFRRAVRGIAADVVHVHSSWAGGFVRPRLRRKAPVVYQPHCYKFVDPSLSGPAAAVFRLLEKALLPFTTVTVVLTAAEARAARSLGAKRLAFIPNVPSLPPGQVDREGMRRKRVVMMGRLVPQKDPTFFLAVVRECRRVVPDLEAVWIGDGPEDVKAMLATESVDVTGWLNPRGVAAVLSLGGVYAHTARYEGLPLAVLEAVQSGMAVVLRKIDAFEGIEELVQVGSAAELAAEVVRVVEDRSAYEASVARGRKLLERHSPEEQVRALRELYESLLDA